MTSSRLAAFAVLCFPLIAESLQPFESVEPHMGTLFRIKLYAKDKEQAQVAFAAAFARIGELDDALSDYKPESELSRLTRTAVGHPVRVSEDLFRVLAAGQRLSEESGGAFDVSVGALTRVWREARKHQHKPDLRTLEQARLHCGYRNVHLDGMRQTVEIDQSGLQLDAGAIAKGDAADQALDALRRHGIQSALVAASGDLAFSDAPPGEIGWKIGLDSFDRVELPFTRVLQLANQAVSTSGPSEQHMDSDGVRYSHIIDPRTGAALTHEITVSVISRRGIDADSFATAVSVLGQKDGLAFIDRQSGSSAIVLTDESGNPHLAVSSRFHLLPTAP